MDVNNVPSVVRPRRPKLGRPRLLIVGCGDIGLRIVARLHQRFRIVALTSSPQRVTVLRRAGAVPVLGNLDQRRSLARLRAFGQRVVHLAPPPEAGEGDPRTAHLIDALHRSDDDRTVYFSTTGVYGDAKGAWIDETAPLRAEQSRSRRRIAAERLLRRRRHACVLRVPGIYAHDRLPLARLRQALPTLTAADDIYTSHIHADDLARIAIAALLRGRPCRVVNAVDDSGLKMGEYFDLVADHHALQRPPRLPRAQLAQAVSPVMLSFMSESRRIRNDRLKKELRVKLRYPTLAAALAAAP